MPDTHRARGELVEGLGSAPLCQDTEFGCIIALASRTFEVPLALISLAADGPAWLKALEGINSGVLEPKNAFCTHAVTSGRLLVVEDASLDSRFSDHRQVRDGQRIRFYAGVPLVVEPGMHVGTFSLLDTRPRQFTEEQKQLLVQMATIVTAMLRHRRDAGTITRMGLDLENSTRLIDEQAAALAQSRKVFERSSAVAKIGVWECDLKDEMLRWTDGVYDLFELPRGSVIDRAQALGFYAEDSRNRLEVLRARAIEQRSGFTFDARIKTAKGNDRWMRLTVNVESESGVAVRIFGMKQDITAEKTLWDRTRYLAEFDTLTGLANRAMFQARLVDLPAEGSDLCLAGALLLIDLDGFKHVNDTFGHALGDQCLQEMALRLRLLCHDAELVARIGGDEFAVLMRAGMDRQAIEDFAELMLEELHRPIQRFEQSFQLGASLGIAVPEPTRPYRPAELFTEADLALYAAKAAGRNTFRVFTPEMKRKADQRSKTVRNISKALAAEQLDLYYQPKIGLADGRLAGFEALLRWRRPDGQVLAAGSFQPALEDPELSNRIGLWVIDKALWQARNWNRAGCDFGHIAINLSSSQFRNPRFADDLIERIARFGLRPDMIEVEVTEGVFLSQETDRVRKLLERLKTSGVRIALDDFGTGYASLVHLRTYPVDIIKIDRSFVLNCLDSTHDRAILEAMIGLGLRLGKDIVAEGIETGEQLAWLKTSGCQMGQGFFISRPVPEAEAARWHRPTGLADEMVAPLPAVRRARA